MSPLDRLFSATAFLLVVLPALYAEDEAVCDVTTSAEEVKSSALLQVNTGTTGRSVLKHDDKLPCEMQVNVSEIDRILVEHRQEDVVRRQPGDSETVLDEDPTVGATEPFTEEGFQVVTAACCEKEMEAFMRRFIEDRGYVIHDEGGLQGMIPFFTCTAEKNMQEMTEAVDNMAVSACPTWVKKGEPIPVRTPECEAANPGEYNPTWHRRRNCKRAFKPQATVKSTTTKRKATRTTTLTTTAAPETTTMTTSTPDTFTTTTTITTTTATTTTPITATSTTTTTTTTEAATTTTAITTTTTLTTTPMTTTMTTTSTMTTSTTTQAPISLVSLVENMEDQAQRLLSDLFSSFWRFFSTLALR